jgi:hypothetical protein
MITNGSYQPGKSGNSATQFKPGNKHCWQQGQSGNAAGIARRPPPIRATLLRWRDRRRTEGIRAPGMTDQPGADLNSRL